MTSVPQKIFLFQSLIANKEAQGQGENPLAQKDQVNLNLLPSALGKLVMGHLKRQAEGRRPGPTANAAATARQGKQLPTQTYPSLSLPRRRTPLILVTPIRKAVL